MKDQILANLNDASQLEKLYRSDKVVFKKEFNSVYAEIKESAAAQFWFERLNYESDEINWGSKRELLFVIAASLIAGFIAKLPAFTSINAEYFYQRNIAFVVFPLLTAYFVWKQQTKLKWIVIALVFFIISIAFINIIPGGNNSDTVILSSIHLPLVLWSMLGFIFIGANFKDINRRIDFLRYNGDLVVMTAIILIAGGILVGVTIGLFRLIDLNVEEFYFKYVVIWGLAATPIVATYLVQTNPFLVNKVSPVIAKVFTPLVLVTLIIYLIAVIVTGKDPYNDREFLLIFNMLLIGVLAIIFFSIAETSKTSSGRFSVIMLFTLSIVTILVNGIALSAILFRISEWGITPNRMAVLGSNCLILLNLLYVAFRLFSAMKNDSKIDKVDDSIAVFLPVYTIWTVLVTFIFPLLFNFR